jgi:hypothetical protein
MPDVTLKLSIGNLSIEVSGPQEYADKKLEELVGRYLSSSVKPQLEQSSRALETAPGKKMSPAEFVKKAGHSNQTDRAMLLGYYMEKMDSQSNFTTGDIAALGKTTKYPFTNVSDSVARLVARGLMMSAGDKDGARAYALTASGEEYVESMISKP